MLCSPPTRLFVIAALAALWLSGSARAQNKPAERQVPEVKQLRIRGTHAVPQNELKQSLATQASGCRSLLLRPLCLVTKSHFVYERRYLDNAEFERDVLRVLVFYFRRGYRDASVDTVVDRRGKSANITLRISEGPPTTLSTVQMAVDPSLVPPLDSARLLRPRVGEPLNLLRVDSTVFRLRTTLWERGFADAEVKPVTRVDSAADTASLRFTVTPHQRVRIDSIRIDGNKDIPEDLIRKSLSVRPGSLFRLSRIAASQRSLYESALFRRVAIDTLPRTPGRDSLRSLVVHVQEGPPREASVSAGFTTADFGQVDARITDNFFLRGARRFDASLTVGNLLSQQLTKSDLFVQFTNIARDNALGRFYTPTYQASAEVRQRWFGSPRNTISAGLFTHRRSSPGVFVDRGVGTSATFTRELGARNRMPLSASYRFEVNKVEAGDVYFCVNYGVCDAPTVGALGARQRLSPVSLSLQVDRANAPFSPTTGYRIRAEVEHASQYTASDFRYHRALLDVTGYLPLPVRRSVLAGHVRAGWVHALTGSSSVTSASDSDASDLLHPRKRFYAGGSQSVRGFGENQLGPRVLTIAPEILRGRAITGGDTTWRCAPSVAITACPLDDPELRDQDFQVRPLGGTSLVEGSVEMRIPIWRALVGAVFVDAALLGSTGVPSLSSYTGAVTPGFGVRYESPVGPIRVDLGFRPKLQQSLVVITQDTDATGKSRLVSLAANGTCGPNGEGCRLYPDPAQRDSFLRRITNRLTLHLSIGQAF